MIYSFAILNKNKINFSDENSDINNNLYKKFNDLRDKNPHLTTMISIGGWSDGSTKYSLMAMNDSSRKEFVESVIDFLETHNFDGLDFNWYKINFNNIVNYLKLYQGISRILR